MAITGQYLYNLWKKTIGSPYTGYWSPPQWNNQFEMSLINCIERRYEQTQDMKFKDEMATFIKTNVVISNFGNNSINLRPIPIIGLTVSGTTWTLLTTVPFAPLSSLLYVNISGVTGFSVNPNGHFKITSFLNGVKGCTGLTFTTTTATGTYSSYSGTFSFENGASSFISPTLPVPQVIDYIHLLNIKCKFAQPLYSLNTVSSTNGTPIVVNLNNYNKLRSSDWKNNPTQITMTGWLTNTAANGTFYIKKLNNLQIALYNDVYLQSPVVGTVNETNNAVSISLVFYNNANRYISTQKANALITPSWDKPSYERAGRQLNIYPINMFGSSITSPCLEVTMDYICNPQLPYVSDQNNEVYSGLYVNASDNPFDLTTIYSEKFLYAVNDELAIGFVESSRDTTLNEIAVEQIQRNP